jgi:hypothetical protein
VSTGDKPRRIKVCKDCRAEWEAAGPDMPLPPPSKLRPAPYPGPRCKTHHIQERNRRRKASHERRVQDVYGLPEGAYDRLYAAQGGKCANPRCTARGLRKRLAVDHDHSCCNGPTSCGRCVRGLLCSNCNDMLGTARDDPQYFVGLIAYLANPPARMVLDERDTVAGDSGGTASP